MNFKKFKENVADLCSDVRENFRFWRIRNEDSIKAVVFTGFLALVGAGIYEIAKEGENSGPYNNNKIEYQNKGKSKLDKLIEKIFGDAGSVNEKNTYTGFAEAQSGKNIKNHSPAI